MFEVSVHIFELASSNCLVIALILEGKAKASDIRRDKLAHEMNPCLVGNYGNAQKHIRTYPLPFFLRLRVTTICRALSVFP